MALALTKFQAYALEIGSPARKRGLQVVELTITGAATDAAVDIEDSSGTFWTEALADAAYGTLATTALDELTKIVAQAQSLLQVNSEALLDRLRVATATNDGEYDLTITGSLPVINFDGTTAPTAWTLQLVYALQDNQFPIFKDLGQ
jgi:hypothetical protein